MSAAILYISRHCTKDLTDSCLSYADSATENQGRHLHGEKTDVLAAFSAHCTPSGTWPQVLALHTYRRVIGCPSVGLVLANTVPADSGIPLQDQPISDPGVTLKYRGQVCRFIRPQLRSLHTNALPGRHHTSIPADGCFGTILCSPVQQIRSLLKTLRLDSWKPCWGKRRKKPCGRKRKKR